MIERRHKQPAEQLQLVPRFDVAGPIVTLVSAVVVARGLVAGAALPVIAPAIVNGAVTIDTSGGTDGERYLITVVVEDGSGQHRESEIELIVIDAAWTMPDGGAPWLTIAEFVDHVGLDEAIKLTDPDGSGRIDRGYLVSALVAAQAIAEANVGGKYALPLATVPAILKLAIVDLAKARLFTDPPAGVAAAAKAAERTLERIASGALSLGIPAANAPSAAPSEAAILIAPGQRAYPDNLVDY